MLLDPWSCLWRLKRVHWRVSFEAWARGAAKEEAFDTTLLFWSPNTRRGACWRVVVVTRSIDRAKGSLLGRPSAPSGGHVCFKDSTPQAEARKGPKPQGAATNPGVRPGLICITRARMVSVVVSGPDALGYPAMVGQGRSIHTDWRVWGPRIARFDPSRPMPIDHKGGKGRQSLLLMTNLIPTSREGDDCTLV